MIESKLSGCGAAGSARGSGLRGRRFKSDHPDHGIGFWIFVRSGNLAVYYGSLRYGGNAGYSRSLSSLDFTATIISAANTHVLYFHAVNTQSSFSLGRWISFPIRCLAC